ncbi:MAG: type II CAAX endopeptidase family protein [Lachnospiraceae bacterium]
MIQISKRVNALFLSVLLLHLTASIILSMLLLRSFSISLPVQLIISELSILIPGFLFLLLHNCNLTEWLSFRKMKWSSVGLTILFTYLLMPLISFVNVFSQLFDSNTVLGMSDEIVSMPAVLMIFIMGFVGPFCEEFVFRGIIFNGYKKTGRLLGALLLSSLLFGLMHMNFNQFCYAFVLGICFALLVEATGSLWSSVIGHVIVNTHNVVMLFGVQKLYAAIGIDMNEIYEQGMTLDSKLYALGLFLILSVVFTALAVIVFIAICKNERKEEHMRAIFTRRLPERSEPLPTEMEQTEGTGQKPGKKTRLVTVSGWIGIAICLFMMFGLTPLARLLGFG